MVKKLKTNKTKQKPLQEAYTLSANLPKKHTKTNKKGSGSCICMSLYTYCGLGHMAIPVAWKIRNSLME